MSQLEESLKANPFDAGLIGQLEQHVKTQVETGSYDFVANKALLKLYGFYPEKRDEHVIALILTKALMNLPSNDILLCLYLIPEDVRSKEPIRDLVRYSEHLDTAKFVEFWEIANLGGNQVLDAVPGFDHAIRSYMVGVLAISYQKVESDKFMDLLALDAAHLDAFVSTMPDKLSVQQTPDASGKKKKKTIKFVANAQNQPRPKTFKESIPFEKMLPVIDILNAP